MVWRKAKASVLIPATSGATVPLSLPMIEGLVIVPTMVQLTVDDTLANQVFVGLSHERNRTPLVQQSIQDPWVDDAIWLYRNFDGNDRSAFFQDLRLYEIQLGGPQSLVGFNTEAGGINMNCLMWYDTKTIPKTEWAAIAKATSFEAD